MTVTLLDQVVLPAYTASSRERALVKGVPIDHLDQVRAFYRERNIPIRVRFRGPRRDTMRLTTLRRHAHAFSVYAR